MKSILLIAAGLAVSFGTGFWQGKHHVQNLWDQDKEIRFLLAQEEERKIKEKEAALLGSIEILETQLQLQERTHEQVIAAIESEFADRLSKQEARTAHYRSLSSGSNESRICLADHAGELAGSLDRGRELVRKLSTYATEWKSRLDLCQHEHKTIRELINEH